MYVKKCQFQYVICLSVENSIILSCPIQSGSKSFLKGLEVKKNTFDPLCLNLAPYLSHCLGFWRTCHRKNCRISLLPWVENSANLYNLPLYFMSYKLVGLKIVFYWLCYLGGKKNWHIKLLTLDLLGTVVSSWSFSWKYIYPLKKKWHYFQNGGNDDLNMFSGNGTTLLMNSNFLTTSGGIKLMDYIIHLWKLIWSPSNCDLIVSCAIKR